ncbi:MAG: hypothetical protein WKF29_08720 [Thermoleophilaceae bacterium]
MKYRRPRVGWPFLILSDIVPPAAAAAGAATGLAGAESGAEGDGF